MATFSSKNHFSRLTRISEHFGQIQNFTFRRVAVACPVLKTETKPKPRSKFKNFSEMTSNVKEHQENPVRLRAMRD